VNIDAADIEVGHLTVTNVGHVDRVWVYAFGNRNLRGTTATILDVARLSARQVADQLGHARVSITQDVRVPAHAGHRHGR
jgi:integrase